MGGTLQSSPALDAHASSEINTENYQCHSADLMTTNELKCSEYKDYFVTD